MSRRHLFWRGECEIHDYLGNWIHDYIRYSETGIPHIFYFVCLVAIYMILGTVVKLKHNMHSSLKV